MKIIERLQVARTTLDGANEITKTTFSSIPFIVAGLSAAFICSVYLAIFKKAENLAFQTFHHHEWEFLFLSPFAFVVSAWLVRRFSPGNGGSGIPQVMATLMADEKIVANPAETHLDTEAVTRKFLSWRVLPIKMLSCFVGIVGGGGIGPEGPCVHLSAVVFKMIRDFWQKYFGTRLSFYNMIVAGGAGGIAAAFNTPLGGIIFAIEELAKSHVATFRLGLLEAVVACGFLSQLLNGPYLYLGFPTMPAVDFRSLLLVLLISFIGGISGAIFGVLLRRIIQWRRKLPSNLAYISAAGAGLASAMVILIIGESAVGSGHEIMKAILFKHLHPTMFEALMTSVGRFVMPLFVGFSDTAAGIFAPTLSAGASLGQFIGTALNPALGNLAPICGMIAFLTGITRTPVTAFVIIMEMTDRHSAIFAMMLSALFAAISARAIDSKSFYERMAEAYLGHES